MLSDIGMNIMEMSQALKAAEIGAGQMDIDPALEVSPLAKGGRKGCKLIQILLHIAWIRCQHTGIG